MVKVKFVNKSGEVVTIYRSDGSSLGVLGAGKSWNRDPKEGTLRTVHVDSVHGQKFPAPREKPYWIDKTEWVWEECPEDSMYAPFQTVIFEDGNVVKLERRPNWTAPEMAWPVVTFLLRSHKMKKHAERLDRDLFGDARVFHNSIPVRISVHALSKYAPYRKWIFEEVMELKDANPPRNQMAEYFEIIQRGEDKRPAAELEKIEQLKKEAEERKKLAMK